MTPRAAVPDTAPRIASDLRGVGRLAIDGVTGLTDVVEAMHATIAQRPTVFGRPASVRTRGLTRLVYCSVRGITRVAGQGVDLSLAGLAPLLGARGFSPQREAMVAALNGVLGDHLEASGNPLAIRMQLRRDGVALPLRRRPLAARIPQATGRLLVQVHGLCMNDLQWNYAGHDHGQALARERGYTAVHLHYNTGRHVSTNGREFAGLLARLVAEWPVPVEEITLLCHSMGGLVARSALDVAFRAGMPWARLPIRVVFLATPHHGAPLERAGSWADRLIGLSPYSAPLARLGQVRSAGIQDLRHGNVRDSDWQGREGAAHGDARTPLPLPKAVRAYAVAVTTKASDQAEGRGLRGDGLVPVASAFGQHADPAFDLRIPASRRWVGHGTHHLGLLGCAAVYQRLARWL